MNNQLVNMMAEIESWESATEFGIPEELWAGYQVRERADDLYIAVLAAVFDSLRLDDLEERRNALADLSKTLLVFSRSTASKYLGGVDRNINLLYCAATFYVSDYPATATFLARKIVAEESYVDEERFLSGLLSRNLSDENQMESQLIETFSSPNDDRFDALDARLLQSLRDGLATDPRLFIASKLSLEVLDRFRSFNIWDCLRENAANYDFETWQPFLMNSDTFPLWELFPSQMAAIESGILSDVNDVFSMQMPTSSGKTSLCEIIIYNEVKAREKRVLFLVPFRALASEIGAGISKRLRNVGVSVIATHGGNIPTRSEGVSAEEADVLIITPEKYAALVQNHPELATRFDTIICDEGHLIDDGTRGLHYELLLTKLKSTEEVQRKMVFISAILPNVNEIHSWLGGEPDTLAVSEYKPVETDFSFVAPQGSNAWQLDFNTIYERPRSYFLRSFLVQNDFRFINPLTGRSKLIAGYKSYTSLACAAALKARRHGPVALFTTMKGQNGVDGLAEKLVSMCELSVNVAQFDSSPADGLPDLNDYIAFQFGDEYLLTRLLRFGMGFHHGDLPQEIRREMESAIQNAVINLLICTSTLAEGVNLPIRTLVVHTIKRFDGEALRPIEQRSIKNIVGRVGRAGKETRGRIIFANNDERSVVEDVFNDNRMESAYGALFRLIENLNRAVSRLDIQLSNEIFESQNNSFLAIIDGIDTALIDLIPPEILVEDIEQYVEATIENTLAYQYCETDELQERIKEVFSLRAQHLQSEVPRDQWPVLKRSGSSPRFWNLVQSLELLDRPEWVSLSEVADEDWIEEVVLRLYEIPTLEFEYEIGLLRSALQGWMDGSTYVEIADACEIEIKDTLKLLGHSVGYQLQDALGKLTQLAIAQFSDDNLSEVARNWSSLLQYGLGDLQQLDLFELGASDRLAVWGVSRYIDANGLAEERGIELLRTLRANSTGLIEFLESDDRVPTLSRLRVCDELGLER